MVQNVKPTTFFTQYAEQDEPEVETAVEVTADEQEIVIPEDLSEMDDEALTGLHSVSIDAFNSLYGSDGSGLTEDHLSALSVLTEGIERVQTELEVRKQAQSERAEAATEMAARAGLDLSTGPEEETPPPVEENKESEEFAAKSRTIRVNLSGLRSRQSAPSTTVVGTRPSGMRDIVKASPEFSGHSAGDGLDWEALGLGLDKRLAQFNRAQWEAAGAAGRHMRTQLGMAVIQKPFDNGLVISSPDPKHMAQVLDHAADEKRLAGNSLVASGGWCAPSETIYDLMEMESRDGIFTLPTIGITRGGINASPGPNYADIFALAVGFHYTEANDIAGNYAVDANGIGTGLAGSKPCFRVPCPAFTETLLEFDGLCITAGLLQQRGYPEMIARTIRGALIAHDHRIAGRVLSAVLAGSTAVAMPANQVGATAPILTAIEIQVEHYRYSHRLTRGSTVEAVFPYWVHGAIRSDLSRRLGIDLTDVPDSRIDGWFRDRGVAPQFVYNFDDLTGAAGTAVAWPTTVRFALYSAGTWVQGTSEIITLDTIYDSVLLGKNDYTALFTEEGWLVVRRGHDSRVVSVNISTDGATHGGVSIDHNGSQSAVAQV